MKKRGLSAVLATAIIVSLTVIGTVILWNAIKPSIDDVEDKLDTGQLNAILDILKVDIIDGLVAKVTVKNRGTGSVSSVKVVISDEDSSKSYNVAGLGEFETKTFDVPLEIVKPVSVEAYPSIKTSSGKVIAGGVRGEAREKDISYSSNSLIGYWDFEEIVDVGGVKKVKDKSGRGSHGRINGDPQVVNSKVIGLGKALEFDGTDDGVDMEKPDVLNQNFRKISIAFWVYPKVAGTIQNLGLVGRGIRTYSTTYDGGVGKGYFVFGYINGWGNSVSNSASLSSWHYVAFVFWYDSSLNKGKIKVYVDGVSSNEQTISSTSTGIGTESFYVGQRPNGYYFKGIIDEVRVYDKALTAEEVKVLYQQGQ